MKEFCIVIPIYKAEMDCTEVLSLNRLKKIIGKKKYDIYFVCSKDLDISNYLKTFPKAKEKRFANKFFKDTATYSQLCINYDFYNSFSDYEFMLIYQLDCYLVRDDIKYWCKQNYDYIGGPIFATDCGWDTISKFNNNYRPMVGNGGFSLRKIETFKELTDPNGEFRTTYELTDEALSNVIFEDKYFCSDIYHFYKLEIPSWEVAINFAIDMNVEMIYNEMKWQKIPMGIHAWPKNIRDWKEILEEIDDEISDFCENKYKDFFEKYYIKK